MRLLSLVHRWTGGLIGLLLALLGLSGTILLWEGSWVRVPGASDALVERVDAISAITDTAAAGGELSRITFASDEIGLHQLTYSDGSGAYVAQDGSVAERWASQWERPELWLFDFHHHLFAGKTGETVTGLAGLAGLGFVLTGLILWWRSRRNFRPTLLPKRFAPGPVVRHHRDLGVIVAPVLLLSFTTGVLMLFPALRDATIGKEQRPKTIGHTAGGISPGLALAEAKALFPEAKLRRIMLPAEPGGPIVVRMRQPFEWTPNGRTQLSFADDGTVTIEDAAAANPSARISEKFYPLHTAKTGGLVLKALMTLSGLSLTVLGGFATWSFWFRKASKRRKSLPRRYPPMSEFPAR